MTHTQILVVEDEYIVAKDIQETLTKLGYHVPNIVASGEDALRSIQDEKPNLVLMDIVLKGDMDGVQTADRIRLEFDIPVIYLTAYTDEDTLKRAKITEPFGYLTKPYKERELHSTIEMAIYRQNMETKLKENEEWLATTLSSIGDGVIATNQTGEITFMNPTAEMWLGWKEEEILNKKFDDIIKIINEKTNTKMKSPITDVMNTGDIIEISENILILTKDNIEIPIEFCASPIIDDNNHKQGVVVVFQDISIRKESEEILKESEDRYRKLVDNFPEPMIVHCEDKINYLNPETVKLMGASSSVELIGKSFLNFVTETYKSDLRARLREIENGLQQQKSIKLKVLALDGIEKDVDISASYILYYGKPAVQLVMKDITAGRKAEEVLRESEEKYRSLVERANDGIAIIREGKVIYANPTICKMTGYELNDIIDKQFKIFLSEKEQVKVLDYYKRRMMGDDVPSRYETIIEKKDGTEIDVEINAGVVQYEGLDVDLVLIREITERKRIEMALRESEEKYKLLVSTSPDAIFMTDLTGKILMINKQSISLYGFESEEQMIGKNFFEFIDPDERKRAIENSQLLLKGQDIKNIHYRIINNNGAQFESEVSSALFTDSSGNPKGFITVVRDITERINIHEALQKSEEKYRQLVEQSMQGIVIAQGMPPKIMFANPSITRILGYSIEELLNFKPEDALKLIHQEDLIKFSQKYTARLKGEDVPYFTELRGIHKDGNLRWLEFYATLIEFGGAPAVQATFLDITERKKAEIALKESEEKYRLLVDNINDGVYTLDKNGVFTFVNKVIVDRSGLTLEKFKKLNFTDIVSEKDIGRVKENFEACLRGELVPPYQLEYKTSSGKPLAVEVNTKPIYKDGEIIGLQGISRDITERKKVEDALRDSEKKLRMILNSMGDAIHVVDSDLRFIMMNEKFIQLNQELGLNSDIKGKHVMEIFPFLPEKVKQEYQQVFKTGESLLTEETNVISNREFITETRKIPIIENDKVSQVITIIRDITNRKQIEFKIKESEERYRTLFENSPDSITLVDTTGTITDCNAATEKLIGYSKDEIIGKKFQDLLTLAPQDLPEIIEKHRELLAGKEIDPYELEIIRKDGSKRWLHVMNSVFRRGEELLGFQVISRDITDMKKSDQA